MCISGYECGWLHKTNIYYRKIHQDLVESLVDNMLGQYDEVSNTVLISQAQALQLLLDVRYLTMLLVPRDNKVNSFQVLHQGIIFGFCIKGHKCCISCICWNFKYVLRAPVWYARCTQCSVCGLHMAGHKANIVAQNNTDEGTSHSLTGYSHSVAGATDIYAAQFTTWLSGHQHKRYPISARNNSSNAHSLAARLATRV
jgi:hypothetical protein